MKKYKSLEQSYCLGNLLGQGQFGKVYQATNKHIPYQQYAIKLIPLTKFKKHLKLKELLKSQINILQHQLHHKNIIKFIQLIIQQKHVAMVYQYCQGGTLEDKIPIIPQQCFNIYKQILQGLLHAQSKNILHRDLKPANILFQKNIIKIADWGFSKILQPSSNTESFIGSPAYMAPQILSGDQYNNKADVWSLGVMIYESIYGRCPWVQSKVNSLLKIIKKQPLRFPPLPLKTQITKKNLQILAFFRRIIKRMLIVDPHLRISLKQLQNLLQISSPKKQNPQSLRTQMIYSSRKSSCQFMLQLATIIKQQCTSQIRYYLMSIILYKIENQQQKQNPEVQENNFLSHRSENKIMNKRVYSSQRQIKLVKKAKQFYQIKLDKTNTRSTTSLTHRKNIKKIISIILNQVEEILKGVKGYIGKDQNKNKLKEKLIYLNVVLDIVVHRQVPQGFQNKGSKQHYQCLQNNSRSNLLKLLNYKLLFLNDKYCKSIQKQ